MSCRRKLFIALACQLSVVVPPAALGLDIGDPAPPLKIAEWVKGAPIDLSSQAARKKVHVVEFWAVWCPPCKMSVPLLTEMQKKYPKDLVIVGVTEPDMGANSPASIRRFVKQQGSQMEYTVAIDTGATARAYMAAAGAIGIPHAFVVARDGRIAWQGSPLDPALNGVLAELVGGTFDVEAAKVEREVNKRMQELNLLSQLGQWTKVWEGLTAILKIDPSNEVAMDILMRISVQELGNIEAYREWIGRHIAAYRGNAKAMQRFAYTLCRIEDLGSRSPDLALEAANAAYKATCERGAAAIAAYARAPYQIGDIDRIGGSGN